MQIKEPLVSVVIPCYNHEDFVQHSVQSVIDQTYKNIELIIIDDGSKDGSVAKIEEMVALCEQRFVRFQVRSRPNKGLSTTLNEAIEWCEGKYVALLASDDIILEHKTQVQVDFLEKNQVITAVCGGVELIDQYNNLIKVKLKPEKTYSFEEIIMHRFELPAATQMIRRDALIEVNGFNPDIVLEDWYMWLKLSQIGKIHYMNQVLALYRQHDTNFSKNSEKMWQGRIEVLDCFRDSKHYPKAIKRVRWLNARAAYMNSKNDKAKFLWELFKERPFKTLNMIAINEPLKKLKNRS
ncbi:glycosyltransferase family 2 protein [Psychrobacter sp. DAB_AL43B]|uniref:glycosyltransferase family 2 protein n=1 Tax=Psychrobacter sp. DAB_AL43B TaxID=1028416 RepID=UPI0009A8A55E|nr:glycosyltransferase [Psychrobacter sp. DAB_AL43B]SLJ84844.1 alpha-1,3-rhamnosyltransferase [Psychrobacter sp. DAB_AL43B]